MITCYFSTYEEMSAGIQVELDDAPLPAVGTIIQFDSRIGLPPGAGRWDRTNLSYGTDYTVVEHRMTIVPAGVSKPPIVITVRPVRYESAQAASAPRGSSGQQSYT
jgi:hypothetical protein